MFIFWYNKLMPKKRLILLILLVVCIILVVFIKNKDPLLKTPKQNYQVILADTEELRVKGLSNRNELEKNKIMLFVFEKKDFVGIWMKDMLFNIDIVYVDENWTVINYFDDIAPSTYPSIYYSLSPAKYVIEMNSGERIRSGIDKGVKLYYK
jgi:uncharacterized membrane protein (UPF0127 family)